MRGVKFLGSFEREFPNERRPEFVFVGRSNVGKSSLINLITGQKVAKVSKEPGRTRRINYFLFKGVYLVDVPGYGFAKVSKEERNRWKEMMENYFYLRKDRISCVFLLIDAKVGPTPLDEKMIEFLRYLGLNFVILLTKVDKVKRRELGETLKRLKGFRVILTSAREGKGKGEILKEMKLWEDSLP